MTVPFIAVGNDELAASDDLTDPTHCPYCGQLHGLEYGKSKTGIEDKTLAFVKCPKSGSVYLVGMLGKRIRLPNQEDMDNGTEPRSIP